MKFAIVLICIIFVFGLKVFLIGRYDLMLFLRCILWVTTINLSLILIRYHPYLSLIHHLTIIIPISLGFSLRLTLLIVINEDLIMLLYVLL